MKKFGKVLLFGAAVGTAAAAAYHYFQKQEKEASKPAPAAEDEDSILSNEEESYFDDEDFDDELDITTLQEDAFEGDLDDPTPDTDIEDMASTPPAPSFSPLSETLMQEEDVEEFFDEDSDDVTEE